MRTYTRSASCNRLPDGQNVASSILIPIMRCTAITPPLSYRQGQSRLQAATGRAHLAARKPAVDFNHGLSMHRRFVFKGSDCATDTGVGQAAGKAVVFDHAAQVQVFNADRVVSSNEAPSQFLIYIGSRVGDLFMDSRHPLPLNLVAVRAFSLACQRLLLAFELPVVAVRVCRVGNTLAAGQRSQTADAEVDTDRFAGLGQGCRLYINDQRDEVAAGGLADNRRRGRHYRHALGPFDFEPSELGDDQTLIANFKLERRAGVFRRLFAVLAFEGWVARAFVEEVTEGGLQMPQGLLRWHAGYLVQPRKINVLLERAQRRTGLVVVHTLAAGERRRALSKETVKHEPRAAERASKNLRLLASGVAAEVPALFHGSHYNTLFCKTNQRRKALPPRPKRTGFPALNI